MRRLTPPHPAASHVITTQPASSRLSRRPLSRSPRPTDTLRCRHHDHTAVGSPLSPPFVHPDTLAFSPRYTPLSVFDATFSPLSVITCVAPLPRRLDVCLTSTSPLHRHHYTSHTARRSTTLPIASSLVHYLLHPTLPVVRSCVRPSCNPDPSSQVLTFLSLGPRVLDFRISIFYIGFSTSGPSTT